MDFWPERLFYTCRHGRLPFGGRLGRSGDMCAGFWVIMRQPLCPLVVLWVAVGALKSRRLSIIRRSMERVMRLYGVDHRYFRRVLLCLYSRGLLL